MGTRLDDAGPAPTSGCPDGAVCLPASTVDAGISIDDAGGMGKVAVDAGQGFFPEDASVVVGSVAHQGGDSG